MILIPPTKVEVIVDPGEYYLGDPCYCFSTNSYILMIESCKNLNYPIATLNGSDILLFDTKYGDGLYTDNQGYEYGVDSGTIGLVPVSLIEKDSVYSTDPTVGRIVKFLYDTACSNDDGVMKFGQKIIINTEDSP